MSDQSSPAAPGDQPADPVVVASVGLERPDRRRPLYVIFLVAGAVLGGAIALTVATRTNSSAASTSGAEKTKATAPASAAAASGAFQNEVTTILDGHIPPGIRPTCKAQDNPAAEGFSIATVACTPALPGGQDVTVVYGWFHDGKAQRQVFTYDRTQNLGAAAAHPGDLMTCGMGPVFGSWWMAEVSDSANGDAPHSVSGKATPMATRGGVMCYQAGDRAVIEWYDNDTRIYAWASTQRQLAPELYAWWVHSAGPWHPAMDMNEMMTPGTTMDPAMGSGTASPSMAPSMSPSMSSTAPASMTASPSMSSNM